MTGLESVVPISEIEKAQMWEALKSDGTSGHEGRTETVTSIVYKLMMRARYNTHRHYEIYAIDVDNSLTSDDLRDWFEQDPQGAANLVRERGRKLYSDRLRDKEVRIT